MSKENVENENVDQVEEPVESPGEVPAEEAVAEADVETPAEEPVAAEPVLEEPVAEEPVSAAPETEPVAEAEALAEPTEEPMVEAEASAEEPAERPAADGAEAVAVAAPAGESTKKQKKKRLPRSERRTRTKVKRQKPAARKPIVRLEKPEQERGRRQVRQGLVVSDAMDKTIIVRVDTVKAHPKYTKVVRRSTRLHAHDESNQAKVGDIVRIVETRPLSSLKRWRLETVVESAK
jgi:small subunit ribosomal protein S17